MIWNKEDKWSGKTISWCTDDGPHHGHTHTHAHAHAHAQRAREDAIPLLPSSALFTRADDFNERDIDIFLNRYLSDRFRDIQLDIKKTEEMNGEPSDSIVIASSSSGLSGKRSIWSASVDAWLRSPSAAPEVFSLYQNGNKPSPGLSCRIISVSIIHVNSQWIYSHPAGPSIGHTHISSPTGSMHLIMKGRLVLPWSDRLD